MAVRFFIKVEEDIFDTTATLDLYIVTYIYTYMKHTHLHVVEKELLDVVADTFSFIFVLLLWIPE